MIDPIMPPVSDSNKPNVRRKDNIVLSFLLGIAVLSILMWVLLRGENNNGGRTDARETPEQLAPLDMP